MDTLPLGRRLIEEDEMGPTMLEMVQGAAVFLALVGRCGFGINFVADKRQRTASPAASGECGGLHFSPRLAAGFPSARRHFFEKRWSMDQELKPHQMACLTQLKEMANAISEACEQDDSLALIIQFTVDRGGQDSMWGAIIGRQDNVLNSIAYFGDKLLMIANNDPDMPGDLATELRNIGAGMRHLVKTALAPTTLN